MLNFLNNTTSNVAKTVLWALLLGVGIILSFTILAQANDQDYYLQCTQTNSCDLIMNQAGAPVTINRYATEPVLSCTGIRSLNRMELERDCELRLSIAQPD